MTTPIINKLLRGIGQFVNDKTRSEDRKRIRKKRKKGGRVTNVRGWKTDSTKEATFDRHFKSYTNRQISPTF